MTSDECLASLRAWLDHLYLYGHRSPTAIQMKHRWDLDELARFRNLRSERIETVDSEHVEAAVDLMRHYEARLASWQQHCVGCYAVAADGPPLPDGWTWREVWEVDEGRLSRRSGHRAACPSLMCLSLTRLDDGCWLLPVGPIRLDSPWHDLLTPWRWRSWKQMLEREIELKRFDASTLEDPEDLAVWVDDGECRGCIHLDVNNAWCNLMELPAAYNPILTPRHGLVGMACCGTGRQE